MLIANGADLNARNAEKQTPLLIALASGQVNVAKVRTFAPGLFFTMKSVQVLIEKGADKEADDANGWTARPVAVCKCICLRFIERETFPSTVCMLHVCFAETAKPSTDSLE